MKHVITLLLAICISAGISRDASADGHRAWQGPNPFSDFTALSGTWVLAYKTVYSSCPDPGLASDSTSVWTVTYRNGAYTATNASRVTFQSVGLASTPASILFRQTKFPRSNAIQLWFTGKRELTGRRWFAAASKAKDDPLCMVYQDVTARKQ